MARGVNFCTIKVIAEQRVRLDRYLRRFFPYLTQGLIEKALRQKKILLNSQKAKANSAVITSDIIEYETNLFTKTSQNLQQNELIFSSKVVILAKKILAQHIFTCDEFIAINKPAGLATQGGSKIDLSVDHALFFLNQTNGTNYKLVHRLDKDTSGVLLIAKGYDQAAALTKAFKEQLISKKYIALVAGKPEKMNGVVVNYLGKNHNNKFALVQEISDGKRAETAYKLVQYNQAKQIALLNFFPKTGRMHQLRFQAKFLGCPIIGDLKYGQVKHKRMYLHAENLVIDPSIFGRKINIQAELPTDFFELIK